MKQPLQHIKVWGNYLKFKGQLETPLKEEIEQVVNDAPHFISYGNGRNYGDCALSNTTISSKRFNKIHFFDTTAGVISCDAGVMLSDVIATILPKGFFLWVTPGTKHITVGGAVASDVHGKNHFRQGTFTDHVIALKLLLPNGEIINCSPQENQDFFHATCGGMGLTGIILEVQFRLKKLSGNLLLVNQQKCSGLNEILKAFQNTKEDYAVAWLNTSSENQIGSGLFLEASHSSQSKEYSKSKYRYSLPTFFPSFLVNSATIKCFNTLKYSLSKTKKDVLMDIDAYFYPLDKIKNLDIIYGKSGMIQYQFVLPENLAEKGLNDVLSYVAKSKYRSFVSVLKYHGEANKNWLSFPEKGYSLAMDFKYTAGLLPFLEELDTIVATYKGKIYLAKDVRMTAAFFKGTYTKANDFKSFRLQHNLMKCQSEMSKRLEI